MSAIIPCHNLPRAELHGGILTAGPHAGEPIYLVDLIDEEGGRFGIWDGLSYEKACEVLADCRQEGMHTIDLLREAL
ncbi:MAG: hypothetical protein K0S56_926 [Microvirga sp.]|jgi:hypothetical protein|nr:hypothetical protein [Microvirga sp.]